jgi:DNA-binding transcriptional regulator YiaG
MTGPALRAALAELGLTRAEFATIIGCDLRTLDRWRSGELSVPKYAARIIDLERENRALRNRLPAA